MRELKIEEVEVVAGAEWRAGLVYDIQYAIEQVPSIYERAINAVTDVTRTATGNC